MTDPEDTSRPGKPSDAIGKDDVPTSKRRGEWNRMDAGQIAERAIAELRPNAPYAMIQRLVAARCTAAGLPVPSRPAMVARISQVRRCGTRHFADRKSTTASPQRWPAPISPAATAPARFGYMDTRAPEAGIASDPIDNRTTGKGTLGMAPAANGKSETMHLVTIWHVDSEQGHEVRILHRSIMVADADDARTKSDLVAKTFLRHDGTLICVGSDGRREIVDPDDVEIDAYQRPSSLRGARFLPDSGSKEGLVRIAGTMKDPRYLATDADYVSADIGLAELALMSGASGELASVATISADDS